DVVGAAFLCRVKENGDSVVVKALNTEAFDRPLDDVFADAQATRRIYQPALIRVREVGYIDAASHSRPYIVTDYFEGPSLAEFVAQNGPLKPKELHGMTAPLITALSAAHNEGVAHRNIRPSNILLRRTSGNLFDVRLID